MAYWLARFLWLALLTADFRRISLQLAMRFRVIGSSIYGFTPRSARPRRTQALVAALAIADTPK